MPYPTDPIVLSFVQAETLLQSKQQAQPVAVISPDLGISNVTVKVSDSGVQFPRGEQLDWRQIQKIRQSNTTCFTLHENTLTPIRVFSETTNRVCSLLPTRKTPSMLIAGFTMHRIVDIDPMQDTGRKITAIAPIVGNVLDTATGLGYTAIMAASTATHVTTIELDPGAQEIARQNPWSRALFKNPKITQLLGDASDIVPTLPEESFDRVIHDPPVFSLAGDLYSLAFYQQLYTVLKHNGRLFHYIGDLNSKSSGTVSRGVFKRLQEAGFSRVVRHPEAFGIVAYK
jgi:predicted methyltransferase